MVVKKGILFKFYRFLFSLLPLINVGCQFWRVHFFVMHMIMPMHQVFIFLETPSFVTCSYFPILFHPIWSNNQCLTFIEILFTVLFTRWVSLRLLHERTNGYFTRSMYRTESISSCWWNSKNKQQNNEKDTHIMHHILHSSHNYCFPKKQTQ